MYLGLLARPTRPRYIGKVFLLTDWFLFELNIFLRLINDVTCSVSQICSPVLFTGLFNAHCVLLKDRKVRSL